MIVSPLDADTYRRVRSFVDTGRELGPSSGGPLLDEVRSLLHFEARLLDQGRLEDWLELYSQDAVYWIPIEPGDDPTTTWALAFDDRRRLEDRVAWLRTGRVHGQVPASRTSRSVATVEAWPQGELCRARCALTCREFRVDRHREWAATVEYLLERPGSGRPGTPWMIKWKVVQLIDGRGPQENLTIVL
jgi:3-phenylpropionate/cinnamic acid dioxygenase small subunit